MAKRKTITVASLVEKVNHMLADSIDDVADARRGMIGVLESVLHDTGNYRGFAYLPSELTTADQPHVLNTTYLRIGYDDTRRRYNLPIGN